MPSIASDLAAAASLLSSPRPQPTTLSQDNDPDGDTPFAALLDVNSPATAAATNPSAPANPPQPPQPPQASTAAAGSIRDRRRQFKCQFIPGPDAGPAPASGAWWIDRKCQLAIGRRGNRRR